MAVILTTELGANETPFGEASRLIVEQFGDFLADELKLVFILLVSFGKDRFFDDFKLLPAFESAVVFSLGLFWTLSFWIFVPLRWCVAVSRGGLGLFRLESLEEELELGGIDLFILRSVEEFNEGVYLLPEEPIFFPELLVDAIFFVR